MTQIPAKAPSIDEIRARRTSTSAPREFDRTPLTLHGTYDVEGHEARACVLLDISPGGACIMAAEIPARDSQIKLSIASLGVIDGTVVRCTDMDFSVQFSACNQSRSKLASSIARHFNSARLGLIERSAAAEGDGTPHQDLFLDNGECIQAKITDVSIEGVAFSCETTPDIGITVRVGAMRGTVVRHFERGFAVAFEPPGDASQASGTG
jgi:hypothetical protein